jgi:hypothetical protein
VSLLRSIPRRLTGVLISFSEDRILRFSAAQGLSVGDDDDAKNSLDDDSPLMMRLSRESVLLGGEEVAMAVTAPVRASELHGAVAADTGYILVTNYRLCWIPDGDVTSKRVDQHTLLSGLNEAKLRSVFSFPLAYVRAAKVEGRSSTQC